MMVTVSAQAQVFWGRFLCLNGIEGLRTTRKMEICVFQLKKTIKTKLRLVCQTVIQSFFIRTSWCLMRRRIILINPSNDKKRGFI